MKTSTIVLAGALALSATLAFAQSSTSERTLKSKTGDPAASSANSSRDTTGMAPNKSGSGTSTSGGRDDNGDQGRDKMPDSNMNVKPEQQQHKK